VKTSCAASPAAPSGGSPLWAVGAVVLGGLAGARRRARRAQR
jgi:MYXO-CTERM domain-containing protein